MFGELIMAPSHPIRWVAANAAQVRQIAHQWNRSRALLVTCLFVSALACASNALSQAASVQGTVTDRTTGLPIANASVYSGGVSEGFEYSTPIATTEANGNY